MARVGWVAVRKDAAVGNSRSPLTPPTVLDWFRLSVFEDGWVEVPGFGRATAGFRGNARTVVRSLALVALASAAGILLIVWANSFSGDGATTLKVTGIVLIIGSLGFFSARMFSLDVRKYARSSADANDLRRLKEAGLLPARVPGTPLFKRASTAEEFASRLTNITLVRAADISDVTSVHLTGDALVQVDGPWQVDDLPYVVDVQLHSGERIRYRSNDATVVELLSRFGVHSV